MKFLIAVLIILGVPSITIIEFPNVAIAQEKVSKKMAIEFLEASQYPQIISDAIDSYVGQVPVKNQAKFRQFMEQAMGWAIIKDQLANLVTRIYSREELEEYIKFSQSAAGKSINLKNIEFSKQFSLLLSQNVKKVINQAK